MHNDPQLFQMIALKHGAKLYLRAGIKPNRMWTLGNMIATIEKMTGAHYVRSKLGLEVAVADLEVKINAHKVVT